MSEWRKKRSRAPSSARPSKKPCAPPPSPIVTPDDDVFGDILAVPLDVMPLVRSIIDTEIDNAVRKVAAEHEPVLADETLDSDVLSDTEVVAILAGDFAWRDAPYEAQQPDWMDDDEYAQGQRVLVA